MNEKEDGEGFDEPSSSIPVTVALIAVTLLAYVVYILRWKQPVKDGRGSQILLQRKQNSSYKSNQYTSCADPGCVRCQKYEIVKAEAQKKLTHFIKVCGDSGLGRIITSLNDLKSLTAEPLQNPNVLYVPGLRSQPFWSGSEEFIHETNLLERQWGFISAEFESIYDDFNKWSYNNTEMGSWSVFYFYNQGKRIDENCSKCPRTAALIESLSSFMKLNIFGNAFFSVLDSGTVVSEHCGPCNIRIRCHLGLAVPEKTSITVGRQTKSYNVGCCVYFDDSFVHSTANHSTSTENPRVVLLLDLWHPDLTMKERDALNYIFPASDSVSHA